MWDTPKQKAAGLCFSMSRSHVSSKPRRSRTRSISAQSSPLALIAYGATDRGADDEEEEDDDDDEEVSGSDDAFALDVIAAH